jgi:hypothetical protein
MSTLKVNTIQSYTAADPVSITDSFKVSGSTQLSGSVSINGNLTTTGNSAFGNSQSDSHVFTGSFIASSSVATITLNSNGFSNTAVTSSFTNLPKVSILPGTPSGISGTLYTVSGSQIFSADMFASGSVVGAISSSLFVMAVV